MIVQYLSYLPDLIRLRLAAIALKVWFFCNSFFSVTVVAPFNSLFKPDLDQEISQIFKANIRIRLSIQYLLTQFFKLIHFRGQASGNRNKLVSRHNTFKNAVAFLADLADAWRRVFADKGWRRPEWIDLQRNAFDLEFVGNDL